MTRHAGPRAFLQATLLLLSAGLAAAAPAVRGIGISVSDLDRAVEFYTGVLAFREVSRAEVWGEPWERLTGVFGMRARAAELRLGAETLWLTEYLTPRGRPIPADSRSNDLWFQHAAIVVRDIDAAYERLRAHGVRHVSTAPQRLPDWNPNAGGIAAFYFQDPDGHNLEIISYPPGKSDPRWQRTRGPLFLGIDHTAIVVSSTERSLAFYRDRVGLEIAGRSENWGTEQEHLNLVAGARLRITALRGASGPGVEFLEYLSPSGGRAEPGGFVPSDLAHWQVILADPAVDFPRGSAGDAPVGLPSDALGYREALLVRDPDGHALLLSAP